MLFASFLKINFLLTFHGLLSAHCFQPNVIEDYFRAEGWTSASDGTVFFSRQKLVFWRFLANIVWVSEWLQTLGKNTKIRPKMAEKKTSHTWYSLWENKGLENFWVSGSWTFSGKSTVFFSSAFTEKIEKNGFWVWVTPKLSPEKKRYLWCFFDTFTYKSHLVLTTIPPQGKHGRSGQRQTDHWSTYLCSPD